MEMFATTAVIIVVAHLALGLLLWLRVRKLYSYPGLLGFPVFGNLYYFYRTLLLVSSESVANRMDRVAEKYGKDGLCFHWCNGFKTVVFVTCPRVVKEIVFHRNLYDLSDVILRGLSPYFQGPFLSFHAGAEWKLKRKEYNIFLRKSNVDREYFNRFIKTADELVNLMMASSSDVDVHHLIIGPLLNTSMGTIFGNENSLVYHPKIINLMKWLKIIAQYIIFNPELAEPILTIFRPIDEIFYPKAGELRKMILGRKDNTFKSIQDSLPIKENSLSMHIVSRSIKNNYSKNSLIKELQELFFTSTNGLTSFLANSIILLSLLPDIQERAWKEQYEIFGNDNRDPTIEDIQQMEFLNRVIKEMLRFLSPAVSAKMASGDININGITIPSGTNVIFLRRYMRMDPKHWKNPKNFDPDRFLEESETLKHSHSPFGIGMRRCPGEYYSIILMKTIFSKILRKLKLRTLQKDFRFEDIQYKCIIMMEVANPPLLQVEERA